MIRYIGYFQPKVLTIGLINGLIVSLITPLILISNDRIYDAKGVSRGIPIILGAR